MLVVCQSFSGNIMNETPLILVDLQFLYSTIRLRGDLWCLREDLILPSCETFLTYLKVSVWFLTYYSIGLILYYNFNSKSDLSSNISGDNFGSFDIFTFRLIEPNSPAVSKVVYLCIWDERSDFDFNRTCLGESG